VVRPGEIVVAFTDVTQAAEVIGRPAVVLASPLHDTLVASADLGIVRAKGDSYGLPFIHFCLGTEEARQHTYARTNGSTVLHLQRDAVETFEFPLPPHDIAASFCEIATPLLARQAHNELESRTLSEIRDVLLPKLLSGEFRIQDAERKVAAAL
jgi:type I restriction enzyme S subunit